MDLFGKSKPMELLEPLKNSKKLQQPKKIDKNNHCLSSNKKNLKKAANHLPSLKNITFKPYIQISGNEQ